MSNSIHRTRNLVRAAVFAALTAILSQIVLPIGPVPFNLAVLGAYLSGCLLDPVWAFASQMVYLLLGLVGIPVFAGFSGGPSALFGPTGGYIVGYVPLALICGLAVSAAPKNRVVQFIGMILGTAVLYTLGTAWYCFQSGNPLGVAMGYCVIPFLPGDFIKMVVAAGVGPMIRTSLEKAGLYPQG